MNTAVVAFRHSPAGIKILGDVRPMFSPDTAPKDETVRLQAGLDALDKLQQVGSDDEKLVASVTRKAIGQADVSDRLAMRCLTATIAELADNIADRVAGTTGLSVTLGQVLAEVGVSGHFHAGMGDGDVPPINRRNDVHSIYLQAIKDHAAMPSERLIASVGLAAADQDKSDQGGRYYVGAATLEQLRKWNNPILPAEFPLARIAAQSREGAAFMPAIAEHAENAETREKARAFVAHGRVETDDAYRFLYALERSARG